MEITNFQEFILSLSSYWADLGCIMGQPYDMTMGAGTFHPHSFLRSIGPEPWRAVYVQPSRRPVDGRYGKSPYRFQQHHQLQVLLKPAPSNIVDLFLNSLKHIGINLEDNDVCLVEDNWEGPTLGAWGLGWEIRANGQEVTQFTYFQQLGGLNVDVVCGEITYGLERLFMYAKGYKNALEMPYNDKFSYGDIFFQNEYEFSHYNFNEAKIDELFAQFDRSEKNVVELCEKRLVLPAYEFTLQASHTFNLLDARGAISVSERQRYIGRVRDCAKKCAVLYREEREKLGFPTLSRLNADGRVPLISTRGGVEVEIKKDQPKSVVFKGLESLKANATCDVLIELGVEEMPPEFLALADSHLTQATALFLENLKMKFSSQVIFQKELSHVKVSVYAAARRLAVQFLNCPLVEPSQVIEVWGPAERIAKNSSGELTPAGKGFCRKNEIDFSKVTFKAKPDGSGVFLYGERASVGRNFPDLVTQEFKSWIDALSSSVKKMKWLPEDISPPFVRPVRWIVALVNDQVIPFSMFGIDSQQNTSGQRILHPESILIGHAREYESALEKGGVIGSRLKRKELILNAASAFAQTLGGQVRQDESVLTKCSGLSEQPTAFYGSIDNKFMRLPAALIVSVLRDHMNYFAVESSEGVLLPYYIGVATYACKKREAMIEGTQNVVTGRLEDGAFYFDTDLNTPISQFRERLSAQLFQANLGSLLNKCDRISSVAETYTKFVVAKNSSKPLSSVEMNSTDLAQLARTAGSYCKADLRTGCVQEFPDEMQGVMGGVLITHQQPFGSDSEVIAKAIAEHYLPSGASARLPTTILGQVLSLADKADTLCLLFNNGEEVKGNRDPFGLRRAALGILRLLGLDDQDRYFIDASLSEVIDLSLANIKSSGFVIKPDSKEKICSFVLGRMKASLKGTFDAGAVEAVLASPRNLTMSQTRLLIHATSEALKLTGEGSLASSLQPYRRCRNLTQNLEKDASFKKVNPALFQDPTEQHLLDVVEQIELKTNALLADGKYPEFLALLASLGGPLALFFDKVLVNEEDTALRNNRLAFLLKIRKLYESVADFSLVQVS